MNLFVRETTMLVLRLVYLVGAVSASISLFLFLNDRNEREKPYYERLSEAAQEANFAYERFASDANDTTLCSAINLMERYASMVRPSVWENSGFWFEYFISAERLKRLYHRRGDFERESQLLLEMEAFSFPDDCQVHGIEKMKDRTEREKMVSAFDTQLGLPPDWWTANDCSRQP